MPRRGMPSCHAGASEPQWRAKAFEHLHDLHFRQCTWRTPVLIHRFTHAGVANALGQLLLSLHYATLHGRTLVIDPSAVPDADGRSNWVWSNGTGLSPTDIAWPSSCDRLAMRRHRHERDAVGFIDAQFMPDSYPCPAYTCSWANTLPTPFGGAGLCVAAWHSLLAQFLIRPSSGLIRWLGGGGEARLRLRPLRRNPRAGRTRRWQPPAVRPSAPHATSRLPPTTASSCPQRGRPAAAGSCRVGAGLHATPRNLPCVATPLCHVGAPSSGPPPPRIARGPASRPAPARGRRVPRGAAALRGAAAMRLLGRGGRLGAWVGGVGALAAA